LLMLTLKQLAEAVTIPRTTAGEYTARFQGYFNKRKVEGARHPKYTNDAIAVLEFIKEAYKKGTPTDVLRDEMINKFPMYDEQEVQTSTKGEQRIDSEGTTAGTPSSTGNLPQNVGSSSMDIVATTLQQQYRFMAQQSNAMQLMAQSNQRLVEAYEKNNTLMDRLIGLLESQKGAQEPKKANKRAHAIKKAKPRVKRKVSKPKNLTKLNKTKQRGLKTGENKEPEKKGFWFRKLF